jgi:hypothetical protein
MALDMQCLAASLAREDKPMAQLGLIATIKTVPGKRDEYLKHLKAHRERRLETEPDTLKFEILLPREDDDTIMLGLHKPGSLRSTQDWTVDGTGQKGHGRSRRQYGRRPMQSSC